MQQWSSSEDQKDFQMSSISNSLSCVLKNTINALSQATTNITYNFKNSNLCILPSQRKPIALIQGGSAAWLLGESFTFIQKDSFIEKFQNIIWISYRKGMKGQSGDVGWGCMIRVVQMMMAETIHRYGTDLDKVDVISLFRQDQNATYSFKKICDLGKIQKRWTSSLQIFNILKQLSQKSKNQIIFDMNNGGVYIQSPNKVRQHNDQFNQNGAKIYPKLINISNRIGINYIPSSIYPHMEYLMKNKYFCGMVGGTSGQALYVVGFYDDKAIILDPHYVQPSQECFSQVYFAKTPRGLNFSQLSPSFAFCYFIRNSEEYLEWAQWMVRGWVLYEERAAFQIKFQNLNDWKGRRKHSDQQFQQL